MWVLVNVWFPQTEMCPLHLTHPWRVVDTHTDRHTVNREHTYKSWPHNSLQCLWFVMWYRMNVEVMSDSFDVDFNHGVFVQLPLHQLVFSFWVQAVKGHWRRWFSSDVSNDRSCEECWVIGWRSGVLCCAPEISFNWWRVRTMFYLSGCLYTDLRSFSCYKQSNPASYTIIGWLAVIPQSSFFN